MKITRLSLDNIRAFVEADFTFNPDFNLIIGINGAGKSTALDAIRFCGSHLLSAVQRMPFKPIGFDIEDIHGDAPFAEASLHVSFDENALSKIIGAEDDDAFVRLREWRTQFATDNKENIDLLRRRIIETTRPNQRLRSQLRDLHETIAPADPIYFYPSKEYILNRARNESSAPLMIHYSTARSIMNEQAERKSAAGASRLAYVNALQSNALSLRQFADWMRAQIEMASERPASRHLVDGVSAALERFLPGYSNLRPSAKSASRVEIDINGTTLDVRQLSDGEHKGLCCYCTGRIRAVSSEMKIEHWQCQTIYSHYQLVYGNLLGACLDGEKHPPSEQHCDTRKANHDLKWNPANAAHVIESRLRYLADGTVESTDDEFNTQINDVLGLNLRYLKNSRKAVLDAVLDWWRSTPNARQRVQQQIDHRTNASEHQPFSPVAVWFLRQKLGGAAA